MKTPKTEAQLERAQKLDLGIYTLAILEEDDRATLEVIAGTAEELARIFRACPDEDLILYAVDHVLPLSGELGINFMDLSILVDDCLRHDHGIRFEWDDTTKTNSYVWD